MQRFTLEASIRALKMNKKSPKGAGDPGTPLLVQLSRIGELRQSATSPTL